MTTVAQVDVATVPVPRPALKRYRPLITSFVSVVVFLVLWQIAPDLGWINGRHTSQPTRVFTAAIDVLQNDDFFHHAWVSFSEFAVGFAMAVVVGVPFGLVLGTSRRFKQVVEPPVMALYMAPRLALLPILIIWLGIGMASKVAMVFLGAVFPIIVNTVAGTSGIDAGLVRAAKSFGATALDIFIKILIPGSLPAILTGIRLGIGRGVLGVVVGEMYVSQAGLGHQLMSYGEAMQVNRLLVYALAVSLFGYTLTVLVRGIEDRISSWKPVS